MVGVQWFSMAAVINFSSIKNNNMSITDGLSFYKKHRQHLVNFGNGTLFFKPLRKMVKDLVWFIDELIKVNPHALASIQKADSEVNDLFV